MKTYTGIKLLKLINDLVDKNNDVGYAIDYVEAQTGIDSEKLFELYINQDKENHVKYYR